MASPPWSVELAGLPSRPHWLSREKPEPGRAGVTCRTQLSLRLGQGWCWSLLGRDLLPRGLWPAPCCSWALGARGLALLARPSLLLQLWSTESSLNTVTGLPSCRCWWPWQPGEGTPGGGSWWVRVSASWSCGGCSRSFLSSSPVGGPWWPSGSAALGAPGGLPPPPARWPSVALRLPSSPCPRHRFYS